MSSLGAIRNPSSTAWEHTLVQPGNSLLMMKLKVKNEVDKLITHCAHNDYPFS